VVNFPGIGRLQPEFSTLLTANSIFAKAR